MTAETGNPKLEIRNSKFETRNSKLETGTSVVVAEQSAIAEASQTSIARRPSSITLPLLLEVGCEEIPARFLAAAEEGLGERLKTALGEARLLAPAPEDGRVALRTYSTPRRLVVHVPSLAARQADTVEEVLGPPLRVAVAPDGSYTRAAESFAARNAARLEDLVRTVTPKGEYLALRKTTPGCPARELLPEILPSVILGLTFPKSMYWTAKSAPRFVRPIRWLVAVLGEGKLSATVEFEVLGVKSGCLTFGHRTLGSRPQAVHGFKDYARKLRQLHVEIDSYMRRDRVVGGSEKLLEGSPLKLLQDAWLVDWIVGSTEWPRPLLGSFAERFLALPREILITVMRDHQRYFALEDAEGRLRPHFLAVLNLEADERGLIRQGHQRVVTARFRDAEFFWNADQRQPLRERLPRLERVTFQAELGVRGSYAEKVRRMAAVTERVSGELAGVEGFSAPAVRRAVELSKCDLTTQMVGEFPELQGVVGGLYAAAQGEGEDVAAAVYDHYLPRSLDDRLPRTLAGAVVSLADKLDNVVAGFAAGLAPTGSSDPFGLRRSAQGAIKLMIEILPPISFKVLLDASCELFAEQRPSGGALEAFWVERLAFYLARRSRYDTVKAVLADPAHEREALASPAGAFARSEALERFRDTEDFVALAQAAKRVRNILSKSAAEAELGCESVEERLLEAGPERDLFGKYAEAASRLRPEGEFGAAGSFNYEKVFAYLATFRPYVDRFFDKVLVMAEDESVRRNRLALLGLLDQQIFSKFVRLSEIVPGTPNVDAST